MYNGPDLLTRVQEDWTHSNLLGLQSCLKSAYEGVSRVSNPETHAAFNTPNRWFLSGVLRFGFVDYYLAQGCEMGLLRGITPVWIKLTDSARGMVALELKGRYTSLIAHHLGKTDDAPRDSKLRFEKRLMNQINPLLPEFEEFKEVDAAPINLTLVHGDKGAEFAYLRAYDNPNNLGSYVSVFSNIMELHESSAAIVIEAEEVSEAEIQIRSSGTEKGKRQAG